MPSRLLSLLALPLVWAHGISAVNSTNVFVGTGGYGFGAGSINPGAQLPYGNLRLGPDTAKNRIWSPSFNHYGGYHYSDRLVRAFSHTHLVGAGVGDLGNFGIIPVVARTERDTTRLLLKPETRWASFRHDNEDAWPGGYSVKLGLQHSVGCLAELTATGSHAGMHRYSFGADKESEVPGETTEEGICGIIVDVCHTAMNDGAKTCKNPNISFSNTTKKTLYLSASIFMAGHLSHRGSKGGVEIFFFAEVTLDGPSSTVFAPPQLYANQTLLPKTTLNATGGLGSLGAFVSAEGLCSGAAQMVIRTGISYLSPEDAKANSKAVEYDSFDHAAANAKSVWEEQLDRIRIYNASAESHSKFYTSLYHSFLAPSRFSESTGRYQGMDNLAHSLGEVEGDVRDYAYTDMSLWDTHRTQMPLLSLAHPKVFEDVIASLQDMLRLGGDIPRWPLANVYTGCMIGSHGFASIAEAVLKNHSGFDPTTLYNAMRLQATKPRDHAGRKAVDEYIQLGFVPLEADTRSASLTLAYAFDDASISAVAGALGHSPDAEEFEARARAAPGMLWERGRSLMCPRHAENGTLDCPKLKCACAPYPLSKRYVEGDGAQWKWFVPHDPEGLVRLHESNATFVAELDAFLSDSRPIKDGGKWPFGTALANGWYWAGNEPDLLAPWLFAFAGAQHLTAKWTRWLSENAYTLRPDGVPGNDDFGTLSAWYVWAAMGLYPLAGSDRFIIGSPLHSSYIRERDFTILVQAEDGDSSDNIYVQEARLNGERLRHPVLKWSQMGKGSVLELRMGARPSPDAWDT